MRTDIERWEKKYKAAEPGAFDAADVTLQAQARWFDGAGSALDIACGGGANLQWLSRRGYQVTGMDGSLRALKLACQQPDGAKFRLIAADLDKTAPPAQAYDAVVVVHYLNRALFPAIAAALKPGGRLFYKTFNRNLLRERPGFNSDFVLEIGELQQVFSGLKLLAAAEPDVQDASNSWVVMEKQEGNHA